MEITDLTADQDYCLEFYYHMHGSDIGTLSVGVNADAEPIFVLEGGRSWYLGCVLVELIYALFIFVFLIARRFWNDQLFM